MVLNELTGCVIGFAIEIHRVLGPGLLESAYEECLVYELSRAGLGFKRQYPLPVVYKEVRNQKVCPIKELCVSVSLW